MHLSQPQVSNPHAGDTAALQENPEIDQDAHLGLFGVIASEHRLEEILRPPAIRELHLDSKTANPFRSQQGRSRTARRSRVSDDRSV